MRLAITGGGTGGHVYPALSILEALLAEPTWGVTREDVLWVGHAGGIEERIMAEEGLAFRAIATGAIRGAGPAQLLRSTSLLLRGVREGRAVVGEFQPDVVLATGGYVSVPLVVGAWSLRRPTLIYLPDMAPGLAVRFLSRFAAQIAVSFQGVARHFRRDVMVSGYPVRQALFETTPAQARQALGLSAEKPVVLVMGGSQGARSINQAIAAMLEPLLEAAQVIHLCGQHDLDWLTARRAELARARQSDYYLYPYLHEGMTDALVAADVAVARAGASTLGEYPAVGLPSILVPYPYSGQHQWVNARYLAENGAAIAMADEVLGESLAPTLLELLADPERLQAMQEAARAVAVPEAANAIAAELVRLAERGT